ncbi:hypothetical protein N8T08_010003 [Aspergillus melleus]|uniref:Uncharacterized protein n=1 Tax=Aspergillus melleus TaxID=138277 RepID=A0ACC3ASB3_9EURO|nr:hypothetical protein N8T08_010003 [Aspergillus melleus]
MSTPVSSSLNVPTTQNTAPVIKFRCLFTHDLRRKAKRWQDGYLRFHTFNKRVMVYDTTGNFVGDLHWRHDESIQDGDELELDRGLIIQVCESMEKTETDISALYAKKSSQGSPSRPADPATPSVRSSTPLRSSFSSQPSRSLNDLLGIKKTPIGHLVSLHADKASPRSEKVDQQVFQRATKRQKTASDSQPRPSLPSCSSRAQPDVIDLSESLDSTEQRASKTAPDRIEKPRADPVPSRITSGSLSTPGRKPKTASGNLGIDKPRSATNYVPRPSSRIPTDRPVNTLRLSNEKPRKKLMYSALLPNQAPSKASTAPLSEKTNRLRDKSQDAPTVIPNRLPPNPDFTPSASTQFALDEMIDDSVHPKTTVPSKSISSRPSAPSPLLSAAIRHNAQAQAQAQGLATSRSSTGLRKSYSDPTALTSANSLQSRTAPCKSPLNRDDDDTNREQGPWTTEALDLFDFWPPGRPKPG